MDTVDAKIRYQDPKVVEVYDKKRFTRPVGRMIDALEKRAITKAVRAVRRQILNPRTLDIPCGTGRITKLLLDEGLDVTGGDISLPMLDRARERLAVYGNRVTLNHLDLEELDLPDKSYDLVTCIRLFNHMGRAVRSRILKEIARVSRNYLVLNISFTSIPSKFVFPLKRFFGSPLPKEPWTWNEIQKESAALGFCVEDYFYEMRYLSEVLVLLLKRVQTAPYPEGASPNGKISN